MVLSQGGCAMTSTIYKAKTFLEYAECLVCSEVAGISDAIIQFVFDGDDGEILYYRIGQGRVKLYQGFHGSPDVTIATTIETWVQMVLGKIKPVRTYLSGKVGVKGDIVLAQRVLKLCQKACAMEKGYLQDRLGDALYILITDCYRQEDSQPEIRTTSGE
jgi:putative sterol carrier protein